MQQLHFYLEIMSFSFRCTVVILRLYQLQIVVWPVLR